MQKTAILPLLALAMIGLTACGKSGSGTHAPIALPNTKPDLTNTPIKPNTSDIQGIKMSITKGKAGPDTIITDSPSINQLTINGTIIDFIPDNFNTNLEKIQKFTDKTARVSGNPFLKHTRYGYAHEGINGEAYLFAQGNATTNVPNSGTATYVGRAVEINKDNVARFDQRQQDISIGIILEAAFDVDFDKKILTGTVGPSKNGRGLLQATISGNKFTGEHNGLSTTGQFYGDDAAELGGTYRNADGRTVGAYGAKKFN